MTQGLLRFNTAGSVDDGKSTLIGRLLHDSHAVYDDQLQAATRASRNGLDLAFLTDGLRAEREQGITIDVAYRFFSGQKRRFIIADTPGHEEYTRNMATGASTANASLILVDASKGVLPQTIRHSYISWLLGIREILVVVNKMDLVGFSQEDFWRVQNQFEAIAQKMPGSHIYFIPVAAVAGDNIVRRSDRMPWYDGFTLLEYLETVPGAEEVEDAPFRMPVQYVIRARGERGYSGRILSGSIAVGDEVLILPSGKRTRVAGIPSFDQDLEEAYAPMSTSLCLEDHVDVGRGDMLVSPDRPPKSARSFQARVVWMSDVRLDPSRPYLIKHTSQIVCANITRVISRLDVQTVSEQPANELKLNDIGLVDVETHRPIFCDAYRENRETGAFIVIDPVTNLTLAAGMIESVHERKQVMHSVSGNMGITVWLTGLSSAGKSTLCKAIYERLWARGYRVEQIDGDEVRRNLSRELGFSKEDRDENVRRMGFLAELLTRNGVMSLVSAISPYRTVRDEIKNRIGSFLEVYVNAPLSVCESRDVKGLYRRARAGEIPSFTGLDDPYEPPLAPDVECRTDIETIAECADKVVDAVEARLRSGREPHLDPALDPLPSELNNPLWTAGVTQEPRNLGRTVFSKSEE
ncbi:MAG TPA: adenylyl-sulfate kinase [Terracidiphilus sp.]